MEVVLGPDKPDVSKPRNGRSLDVDMEMGILEVLEVSEALVVTVAIMVLVVTLVKVVMEAMVDFPIQLLDSIYGFTYCFLL
jgi:hypothetical protein